MVTRMKAILIETEYFNGEECKDIGGENNSFDAFTCEEEHRKT